MAATGPPPRATASTASRIRSARAACSAPDLDPGAGRERRRDPVQAPARAVARLVDADVGQVDREVRARWRVGRESAGERDVRVRDPVGLGRVGDVLAEEVDRGEDAVRGQPARGGERVVGGGAGDVAGREAVRDPVATGGAAHRVLEPFAGRELEQNRPR